MIHFSQRLHLTPVELKFQKDGMDKALRTRLWNVLERHCWSYLSNLFHYGYGNDRDYIQNPLFLLPYNIQEHFFNEPLDELDGSWENLKARIRTQFFEGAWYSVYDLIEFLISVGAIDFLAMGTFRKEINDALIQEKAAYRLLDNLFAPIVDDQEISSVNQCIKENPYEQVRSHIQQATILFSDREKPDYRNSIKESISAVEAICKLLTGDEHATLGKALKKLSDQGIVMHEAFQKSVSQLYGYTSDEDGIRHCLMDESKVNFADAKYMLVACSAFCNFLVDKGKLRDANY